MTLSRNDVGIVCDLCSGWPSSSGIPLLFHKSEDMIGEIGWAIDDSGIVFLYNGVGHTRIMSGGRILDKYDTGFPAYLAGSSRPSFPVPDRITPMALSL